MAWWGTVWNRQNTGGFIPLDDALDSLGFNGDTGPGYVDVSLANVVGSAAHLWSFDHEFRPVNRALEYRREQQYLAGEPEFEPPPVQLVELSELYFMVDGHHRPSAARASEYLRPPADDGIHLRFWEMPLAVATCCRNQWA